MPNSRLTLALEQMGPGDWLTFERFAAEFNAVEFPSLRTTAAFAGDKGRDGQLFKGIEDPTTAFQYSVTESWRAKVLSTLKTLKGTRPGITRLIYCTNQAIGPVGDELVEELRRDGIALDIRDRSWFVDRELTHPQREIASQELAERYVDPLLQARGIAERVARSLTSDEARVALLHLALEGYDQGSEKNLTRSCFESLVRSVLHNTDAEHTMSLANIVLAVRELVPAGDESQVEAQTRGALQRLSTRGGPVKQVGKSDTYHLSFQAQEELKRRSVDFLLESAEVDSELRAAIKLSAPALEGEALTTATLEVRTALEATLAAKSEGFAVAVVTGEVHQLAVGEVLGIVRGCPMRHLTAEQATGLVLDVLEAPGAATRRHLRQLADGYTLFAFLRQTPDVQKVVLQVFQEGDIWLDTSVILPLMAETLLDDPSERYFTSLMQAALDAGLKLYVTEGIIEEIERHLHRCLTFARTEASSWNGRVPFLYAAYTLAGRGRNSFVSWLEEFRGGDVPEEDIKQFLDEEFRIGVRNLTEYADGASTSLRAAVQEIWHEVHDRRRGRGMSDITPAITLRLVAHDVENCVGVIELRRGSPMGPMGYRVWWLTLDRTAFTLGSRLRDRLGSDAPRSPALSPDFLVELLRLGPMRSALERDLHVSLPVMADIGRYESLPIELIRLADSVRRDNAGLSERIIARRVRDAINGAKWRRSSASDEARVGARATIEQRLAAQAAGGLDLM